MKEECLKLLRKARFFCFFTIIFSLICGIVIALIAKENIGLIFFVITMIIGSATVDINRVLKSNSL